MRIGNRCTICNGRIDPTDLTSCDTCGRELHRRCREYETAFECRYCSDESWIGATEF
ncbi:hypothetical protein [Natrialbaceae archaeon AArc-T1-2]|uniref:hypothetical protein n=1 Tax=Natrialbaceae archaeon AArc-T1-2 TaxID=3053904 RepID=UPI00255A7D96|nr:hypothetical protein [Natrialbaceae archaeon AArc-T1-2]WIV65944.1 hypothetical protein QQ977_09560 [Natrialbaceae archaeon AArc-T1-2]